jgi:hypothetical protein
MAMRCLFIKIILLITISGAYARSVSEEVLQLHNQYRAKHHAPALAWDETLAIYAKRYASQCLFKHSHGRYGENIAAGYPSVADAVRAWYGEYKNYSYAKPGFAMNTGHFTQLVWRSSKKLGCAYVACDGQNGTPGNFLVCEYSPAGNVVNAGYFAVNVLPPSA